MLIILLTPHNCPLGDPTVHGFTVHGTVKEAVRGALNSDSFNGLGPAHGELLSSSYQVELRCTCTVHIYA